MNIGSDGLRTGLEGICLRNIGRAWDLRDIRAVLALVGGVGLCSTGRVLVCGIRLCGCLFGTC